MNYPEALENLRLSFPGLIKSNNQTFEIHLPRRAYEYSYHSHTPSPADRFLAIVIVCLNVLLNRIFIPDGIGFSKFCSRFQKIYPFIIKYEL